MLSLFKPKYYLKDILPQNYIDIHNHILPGIDDGAKTLEETTALISKMKAINIAGAIPTPHTFYSLWNNTPESIKKSFEIATATKLNNSFLRGYASEYMLDQKLIKTIKKEPLLCLYEDYILIEFHLYNYPINLYEMLFELKLQNYKIVLAHPERYLYLHNSINKYRKLKEFGVYFQLNLLSLIGYYGKEIQAMAEVLLHNGLYDFTGTDIHNERQISQLATKPISFSKRNILGDLLQNNKIFNPFSHVV
ncbi:MAG: hypothetical protein B7Y83_12695 [Flavobacteriales bacterium 32-34-25]|nr:MAG: hypothetical protein B7Y83_12695 [Flavobacteriales bacterium 32-34-25]